MSGTEGGGRGAPDGGSPGSGAGDSSSGDPFDILLDLGLHCAISRERTGRTPVSDSATFLEREKGSSDPNATGGPVPADGRRLGRDGRYQLTNEIGRGGMGVVYQAKDLRLGRTVALKALRDDLRRTDERVQRFVEEAQIAGQLQHPGIVPVHDLGLESEGPPFFTMKLVSGETLKAKLAARESVVDQRERFLRVFLAACEAVAYAHARGVIHRDLKPSNIMVGSFGEVHVVDWGLAKVLGRDRAPRPSDASSIMTVRREGELHESLGGTVMGTPAYMAPEQARGEIDRVAAAADVFSLGAILTEILTGYPPYFGEDQRQVHAQAAAARTDAAFVRLDASTADPALVALAKACLAVDPAARPEDAGAVAQRVADHLASLEEQVTVAQVKAQAAETEARHQRRARRLTVALAAAVVLAVFAGVGVYLGLANAEAKRGRRTAAVVMDALNRATGLGLQGGGDPEERLELVRQALAAAEEARRVGVASNAPADVIERAQTAVAGFRSRLADAEAAFRHDKNARRLRDRLDELRLVRVDTRDLDHEDAAFAAAFRDFGVDLDQEDAESVARRLSGPRLGAELAPVLDWWACVRRRLTAEGNPRAARVLEIGRLLDPDPLHRRIRDALHAWNAAALRESADDQTLLSLPRATAVLVADVLGHAGAPAEALRLFRLIQVRYPDDVWAQCGVGHWLADGDETDREEALRAYTAALALAPGNAAIRVNVAALSVRLGRADSARAILAPVMEQRPDLAMAHVIDARIKAALGDRAAVEPALEHALELEPRLALAEFDLGLAAFERRDYDAAARRFETVVGSAPDLRFAWSNLALCYQRLGRSDTALSTLEQGIARHPGDADLHAVLGSLRAARNELARATVHFETAARLAPERAERQVDLGGHYTRVGRLDDSEAALRKALVLDPKLAAANANLAQILRQRRRFADAIAYYERARDLGGPCPEPAVGFDGLIEQCRAGQALERTVQRVITGLEIPADDAAWEELTRWLAGGGDAVRETLVWEARVREMEKSAGPGEWIRPRALIAAARAGTRSGTELLNDAERARFRGVARRWFETLVRHWEATADSPGAAGRRTSSDVRIALEAPDLAPLRDDEQLATLPLPEAEAWRHLWNRVKALE